MGQIEGGGIMTFGLSAATLATVAAAGVGAAASAGAFGGGGGGSGAGSGGSAPNIYQPYGETNQDTNFQQQQNYITGQSPWQTLSPEYAATSTGMYGDPNANWAQTAANNAGILANSQAVNALGTQNTLNATGNSGIQAGSGLWDQSRVAASSPLYGAALEGSGVGGGMLQQGAGQDYANAGALMPQAQYGASRDYSNAAGLMPFARQQIGATLPYATQNAGNLQGAGNAVLNTAFDPQNALYNQLFQQNTDQTRAGLEARGLDTSATGQGIENDSNQRFNIAWQNAQLGRQAQGLSSTEGAYGQGQSGLQAAYGQGLSGLSGAASTAAGLYAQGLSGVGDAASTAAGLYGTAGNQYAAGSALPYQLQQQNLNNQIGQYGAIGQGQAGYGNMVGQGFTYGNQAVGLEQQSGALPYQTSQGIYANRGNALNNYEQSYLQAMTPYQQSAQNSLQYMGLGVNAGNAYSQAAARSWGQGQQQNQNIGAGISGLINQGPSLYNSIFGGVGGGGDYALSASSLNPGGFGG
jgi:hypothetical protein